MFTLRKRGGQSVTSYYSLLPVIVVYFYFLLVNYNRMPCFSDNVHQLFQTVHFYPPHRKSILIISIPICLMVWLIFSIQACIRCCYSVYHNSITLYYLHLRPKSLTHLA